MRLADKRSDTVVKALTDLAEAKLKEANLLLEAAYEIRKLEDARDSAIAKGMSMEEENSRAVAAALGAVEKLHALLTKTGGA